LVRGDRRDRNVPGRNTARESKSHQE
jgi:hypothetical protein